MDQTQNKMLSSNPFRSFLFRKCYFTKRKNHTHCSSQTLTIEIYYFSALPTGNIEYLTQNNNKIAMIYNGLWLVGWLDGARRILRMRKMIRLQSMFNLG